MHRIQPFLLSLALVASGGACHLDADGYGTDSGVTPDDDPIEEEPEGGGGSSGGGTNPGPPESCPAGDGDCDSIPDALERQ